MKERIFVSKAKEEIDLEEFIRSQFRHAKCGDIEIQHTPLMTRIIVHTTTPGLIIGAGGERIKEISEKLRVKFKIDNPQIDIQKIESQFLDPKVVASALAAQVESGVNYKRLGNFYLEKIMASGAIGCEIIFSGKMAGERSRRDRFTAGYLKKCGHPAMTDVGKGFSAAIPRLGAVGISVKIATKNPVQLTKMVENLSAAREAAAEEARTEEETKAAAEEMTKIVAEEIQEKATSEEPSAKAAIEEAKTEEDTNQSEKEQQDEKPSENTEPDNGEKV